jgi:hypothetical protein
MTGGAAIIEVAWIGPFGWPEFENVSNLPPIPSVGGVYLQTFEYQSGYLIYAAGLTRRPIPSRFREHTRKYWNGEYNVLDIDAVRQGIRREVWHGWAYAREHRAEFEERKPQIVDAVRKQLEGFRIFVSDPGTEQRILERLEAAIMNNLYQQSPPICDIPDRGMQLAPRWKSERAIVVKNKCTSLLYGLPPSIEV